MEGPGPGVDLVYTVEGAYRHEGAGVGQARRYVAEVEAYPVSGINAEGMVVGGVLDHELGCCGGANDVELGNRGAGSHSHLATWRNPHHLTGVDINADLLACPSRAESHLEVAGIVPDS